MQWRCPHCGLMIHGKKGHLNRHVKFRCRKNVTSSKVTNSRVHRLVVPVVAHEVLDKSAENDPFVVEVQVPVVAQEMLDRFGAGKVEKTEPSIVQVVTNKSKKHSSVTFSDPATEQGVMNESSATLVCHGCDHHFSRRQTLIQHVCPFLARPDGPVRKLKLCQDAGQWCRDNSASERLILCQSTNSAIPGIYPPLFVHRGTPKHIKAKMEKVGAVNPYRVLGHALREMRQLSPPIDFLEFPTNYEVIDRSGMSIFLSPPFTTPQTHTGLVVNSNNSMVCISLPAQGTVSVDENGRAEDTAFAEDVPTSHCRAHYSPPNEPYHPHQWPSHIVKACNVFRQPWRMTRDGLANITGLSWLQFWDLCDTLQGATVREREIVHPARCLLMRMKFRTGLDNRDIAVMFGVAEKSVRYIFYSLMSYHVFKSNFIPNIFGGCATDELAVSQFYQRIVDRQCPFHRELLLQMNDPTEQDRIGVGCSIDSVKVAVQNSTDFQYQKVMYHAPKAGHFLTLTSVTDLTGYVMMVTKLSVSSTPRSGDSRIVGLLLHEEQDDINATEDGQGPSLEIGLSRLLKGTSTHFAVVAADKGYTFIPPNVSQEGITDFRQWSHDNGCLLLWPHEKGDPILQVDPSVDKVVYVDDVSDPNLIANSKQYTGFIRHSVEAYHGALAQDLLISNGLPFQFMEPIGEIFCREFDIPIEYKDQPRALLLILSSIGIYNQFHPKFHLHFITSTDQIRFAMLAKRRLNMTNPFQDDSITFDVNLNRFPADSSQVWNSFQLSDLATFCQEHNIPRISPDNADTLYQICLGPYKAHRGIHYTTLLRQSEVNNDEREYNDIDDFWEACKALPQTTTAFFYHQVNKPTGWKDEFFIWPDSGVLLVTCKLPSANRSVTSTSTFKRPMLVIGPHPSEHLGFTGPLQHLYGWKCASGRGVPDVGSRLLGSDSHVMCLAYLIFCHHHRYQAVIRRAQLSNSSLPRTLQPTVAVPTGRSMGNHPPMYDPRRRSRPKRNRYLQSSQSPNHPPVCSIVHSQVPSPQPSQATRPSDITKEDATLTEDPPSTPTTDSLVVLERASSVMPTLVPLNLTPPDCIHGLINDGNICYAIAVCQALCSTAIADVIITDRQTYSQAQRNFAVKLKNDLTQIGTHSFSLIPLINMLNACGHNNIFTIGQFEDAGEFLLSIFNNVSIPDWFLTLFFLTPQHQCNRRGNRELEPAGVHYYHLVLNVTSDTGPVDIFKLCNDAIAQQLQTRCPARGCRGVPCAGSIVAQYGLHTILQVNRTTTTGQKVMTQLLRPDEARLGKCCSVICHVGNSMHVGHWITYVNAGDSWWKLDDNHAPQLSDPFQDQFRPGPLQLTINTLFFKQFKHKFAVTPCGNSL